MIPSDSPGGTNSGESTIGALWSAELRSKGVGRFFGAGFLGLWLCGWFVGECFALAMMGGIVLQAVRPDVLSQLGAKFDVPTGVAAIAIVGFLALWTTIWTIGGFAAITQLLRQLGGVDRIELHPAALVVRRRAPIGQSVTRVPIERVMDIRLTPRQALVVVDRGKQITVSDLGDAQERQAVLLALRPQLRSLRPDGRSAEEQMSAQLPDGWHEVSADGTTTGESSGFGTVIVSRNRGRVAGLIFVGLFALVPAWVLTLAMRSTIFIEPGVSVNAGDIVGPLVLFVILGLVGAMVWTWRREIRLRPGTIEARWSVLGRDIVRLFEGARLEIEYGTDSDGDPWYKLVVWSGADHATLTSSTEYAGPLHLGRWLARRLGSELKLPREMRETPGDAA